MRGAAAYFTLEHRDVLARPHDILLCSSYLALAELRGVCPWLATTPCVLYFHENRLGYPPRHGTVADRDLHFGLSMLEATHLGARPLVPDRLAYRLLYPDSYRYRDDDELASKLAELVRRWTEGGLDLRADRRELTRPYLADAVVPMFAACFEECVALGPQNPSLTAAFFDP
jgi:hypothetical protein